MSDENFIKFLEENHKVVSTFPKWERELLGPYPKNIHNTEQKDTKKPKDRFDLLDFD